jgi:serine/threonine protein kinase HipA of HipAB toxin-antitoxin module
MLCPLNKFKPCHGRECAWFREGVMIKKGGEDQVPFASCVVDVIAHNVEATNTKMFRLQREMGVMRHEMTEMKKVQAALALVQAGVNGRGSLVDSVEHATIHQLEGSED